MSYLVNLTLRLAVGASRLAEDVRARHAAWLLARQNPDGGFSGREGPSDLYYTGFALRGLTLVDQLAPVAGRAAEFLRGRLGHEPSAVDRLSLVESAVMLLTLCGVDPFAGESQTAAEYVEQLSRSLARDDGGYAKTAESPHSSTYHTFLVTASRQIVGLPCEQPENVAALIRSRRRDDGGFVELAPLKQSGTNPTAAAVAVLGMLDALDPTIRRGAADFLGRMQNAEGGLRANTRVPLADLLSTFTGLAALAELRAAGRIDRAAAARYVAALEQPGGGFRGGLWDQTPDVEYTFYGLGVQSLLAAEET